VVVLLTACSDGATRNHEGAGTSDDGGTLLEELFCRDRLACRSDADCASYRWGKVCHERGCCVECVETADCSTTAPYCDRQRGICTQTLPTSCEEDEDCCGVWAPCLKKCEGGTCQESEACERDIDCLGGRVCAMADGERRRRCHDLCWLPQGRCPSPLRCGWDGLCHSEQCKEHDDCPFDWEDACCCCNGECLRHECYSDSQCPAFEYGAKCWALDDCGQRICTDGWYCDEVGQEGICRRPRVCDVDPTSATGMIRCLERCDVRPEPQCPPECACSTQTGLCACPAP